MAKPGSTTIITHIAGWILFMSLPVAFITGQANSPGLQEILSYPQAWIFFVTFILIFYFNTLVLIPYLYAKKKFMSYALAVMIIAIGVWFVQPFEQLFSRVRQSQPAAISVRMEPPRVMDQPPGPPPDMRREGVPRRPVQTDIISLFILIILLILGMAIHVRQKMRKAEQDTLEAMNEKVNAELSFLKAQINPHFLFNTLNNLYSLAIAKSDHAAPGILRLSNIMRYVTDDVQEDLVPLDGELDCIRDYLFLQQLRLSDKTTVSFKTIGRTTGKKIPPLVLMTFIENAFKYGVSNRLPGNIDILLETDENQIYFECSNDIVAREKKENRSGIGLSNTRKRLDHLYPGRYKLAIEETDAFYRVQLTLE